MAPSGCLPLLLFLCCLVDASNSREGRAAVWACLWLSVKHWTVNPTNQPDTHMSPSWSWPRWHTPTSMLTLSPLLSPAWMTLGYLREVKAAELCDIDSLWCSSSDLIWPLHLLFVLVLDMYILTSAYVWRCMHVCLWVSDEMQLFVAFIP